MEKEKYDSHPKKKKIKIKKNTENINIYNYSYCFMYNCVEVYVWVIYYIDSKKDWQLIMRIIQLTNFFCLFILFS